MARSGLIDRSAHHRATESNCTIDKEQNKRHSPGNIAVNMGNELDLSCLHHYKKSVDRYLAEGADFWRSIWADLDHGHFAFNPITQPNFGIKQQNLYSRL